MVRFDLIGVGISLVVAFLVWTVLLAGFFPSVGGFFTIPAILLAIGTLATLKSFVPQLEPIFPVKISMIMSVGILVAGLFLSGALVGVLGGFGATVAGGIAAPAAPSAVPVGQVASLDECLQDVTAEQRDDTATAVLNAFDQQSNTPDSATVNAHVNIFLAATEAETGRDNFLDGVTDTTGNGFTTGLNIGDTITIGGNSTGNFYVETREGICLNKPTQTVTLNVHQRVAETGMTTTVYDRTGSTQHSNPTANGNSTCQDYTYNSGTDERVDTFYELRVNASDRAYNLIGLAFSENGEVLKIEPVGNDAGLFTKVAAPLWLSNEAVPMNSSHNASAVNMDFEPWVLASPVLVTEFQTVKYHFQSVMTSVAAANDVNCDTDSDVTVQIWLDQDSFRGADGGIDHSFYNKGRPDTESNNVGVAELANSPFGRTSGSIIEWT